MYQMTPRLQRDDGWSLECLGIFNFKAMLVCYAEDTKAQGDIDWYL